MEDRIGDSVVTLRVRISREGFVEEAVKDSTVSSNTEMVY